MLNLVIKRVWERYMKTFRDHCTTVTVLPFPTKPCLAESDQSGHLLLASTSAIVVALSPSAQSRAIIGVFDSSLQGSVGKSIRACVIGLLVLAIDGGLALCRFSRRLENAY